MYIISVWNCWYDTAALICSKINQIDRDFKGILQVYTVLQMADRNTTFYKYVLDNFLYDNK